MTTIEADRLRLSQADTLTALNREIPITEMVTVYLSDGNDLHDRGIYCALIPTTHVERSLSSPTWDLTHGSGCPGSVGHSSGGHETTKYFRFGDDSGIEPLVIDRVFHGVRPSYPELCEEFRLFHNLYHDRKQDSYFKFDDCGNEDLVAVIEPNRVQVRLKEIRQFLAVKEMHLAIQFDCREHSSSSLKELGLDEGGEDSARDLLCWGLHYGDGGGVTGFAAFSRLLGKRLIPPLPKGRSGFPGFEDERSREYIRFIIGTDNDGNEVQYSSDPDGLANYFGANPGAPPYLTPVFFRKAVLDKYYHQPGKYSVEPCYLRCVGLWGVSLDNDQDDFVVVWLGDAGRDLPYEEQLHWRSYNVAPAGRVSDVFFRQQILAEFADTDRPEHLFKREYDSLIQASNRVMGWPILLPLSTDDAHFFHALRVPSSDEQRDFDDVVLALTKVLVDSLNEKELNKLLSPAEAEGLKGSISRLAKVCGMRGLQGHEGHIRFLRDLQDVRSSGSAHRKGTNYRKIAEKLGFDAKTLRDVFKGLLVSGLDFIRFLSEAVELRQFATP